MHNIYSLDDDLARFRRLQSTLSDKMTELYLLFYSHVLHYFVRLNLFLQREEPVIAVIHEQVIILCVYRYTHNYYISPMWVNNFVDQVSSVDDVQVPTCQCTKG